MKSRRVLIYGAAGHTGRFIARRAVNRGLDVIVAGRSSRRLDSLARSLRCEWRAAAVDDPGALADMLRGVAIVVNAAGPFEATARPLVNACVTVKNCHYLDIGGEVAAFRYLQRYDAKAEDADVLVMPGVGFCVIASTFLMKRLVPLVQKPTMVRIAFSGGPASSIGSIKSLYASLYEAVTIVRDRDITYTPIGSMERAFDFKQFGGRRACTAISVSDTVAALCDAPDSVRQIESYVEGSLLVRTFYESSGRATRFSKVQPWKSWVEASMGRWPATPDTGVDTRATVLVEVEDPWRAIKADVYETPNTYEFTAIAACEIAELLIGGVGGRAGFHTPASLFYGNPALHQVFALKSHRAARPSHRGARRASP